MQDLQVALTTIIRSTISTDDIKNVNNITSTITNDNITNDIIKTGIIRTNN